MKTLHLMYFLDGSKTKSLSFPYKFFWMTIYTFAAVVLFLGISVYLNIKQYENLSLIKLKDSLIKEEPKVTLSSQSIKAEPISKPASIPFLSYLKIENFIVTPLEKPNTSFEFILLPQNLDTIEGKICLIVLTQISEPKEVPQVLMTSKLPNWESFHCNSGLPVKFSHKRPTEISVPLTHDKISKVLVFFDNKKKNDKGVVMIYQNTVDQKDNSDLN